MKLDLHNHTHHSHDAITIPKNLVRISKEKDVVVAVTDHNNTGAWKDISNYAREFKHDAILGEEIKVEENGKFLGEFVGLFMNEEIPRGNVWEVLDKLREQDAFVTIVHPFDRLRSPEFRKKEWFEAMKKKVDAFEIFNARCQLKIFNNHAKKIIEKNSLPFTAGSDSHTPNEIGNAFIEVDTDDLEEARRLMKKGKAVFSGRQAPQKVHFLTQLAKWDLIEDKDD